MIIDREHPIMVDSQLKNKQLNFNSTDTEENYLKSKKKYGPHWYYHDKIITYDYNEWGYRTKNFNEIRGDYILTLGCSYTEGIGLCNEDVWANRLGKKLGLEVCNLGKGGTGGMINLINTTLFYRFLIKNNLRLPKYVIYQWSFAHRISLVKEINNTLVFKQFTANHDLKPNLSDFFIEYYIKNDGEIMKNIIIQPLVCDNLWSSAKVPSFHWSWSSDPDDVDFCIKDKNPNEYYQYPVYVMPIIDNHKNVIARDNAHNGHLSHLGVSNKLYEIIKKKII